MVPLFLRLRSAASFRAALPGCSGLRALQQTLRPRRGMSASLPEGVPPHSNRLRAAQPASRDRFECSTHGPGGHGRCDVESEQREQETDDWEAFVAASLTRQPGELYGRVVRYH